MFDHYVSILNQKYPYLLVDGANFDPPGLNMFMARALVSIQNIMFVSVYISSATIFICYEISTRGTFIHLFHEFVEILLSFSSLRSLSLVVQKVMIAKYIYILCSC